MDLEREIFATLTAFLLIPVPDELLDLTSVDENKKEIESLKSESQGDCLVGGCCSFPCEINHLLLLR